MQHSRVGIHELKAREIDRLRVDFHAFLRFERTPELPVEIRDFSGQGFMCRSSERLAIGSRVILRVPKVGQFSATIVWQLGLHAGARFDAPLPVPTVLAIVVPAVRERVETDDTSSASGGLT